MMRAADLISSWRESLDDEKYVSSSRVQDNLLGLWGEVGDDGTQLVEQWLILARQRSLFEVDEVRGLLDEIEAATTSLSH